MSEYKRKVSFYYLSVEKENGSSTVLNSDEVEELFIKIYSKMRDLGNGRKAITINGSSNNYVIEIIDYSNHIVFAQTGRQNYANTVALRDKTTLETEKVRMTPSQLLELYTYFLIDFRTGIISYIGINGAPRISAVKELFNVSLIGEEKVSAILAAIMTNDILKTLVKKDIISKLSITIAVPSDNILSDILGISGNDYDILRNIRTRTATYSLRANRNKNIFHSSGKLAELIENIKAKHGDNLKDLSVNAKDNDEKSEPYDILRYYFTKTVTLGGEDHTTLSENDFKVALADTYASNKDVLLKYIKY